SMRPSVGSGLIGGTGRVAQSIDADIIVAANGGSDLIYAPRKDVKLVKRLVEFLVEQDYVSGLFVDDEFGMMPGALPQSVLCLKGCALLPQPAIIVCFRNFATDPDNPINSQVIVADCLLQEGQGMHGSFGRGDTMNFMAASGPDFKTGFVDDAP